MRRNKPNRLQVSVSKEQLKKLLLEKKRHPLLRLLQSMRTQAAHT